MAIYVPLLCSIFHGDDFIIESRFYFRLFHLIFTLLLAIAFLAFHAAPTSNFKYIVP